MSKNRHDRRSSRRTRTQPFRGSATTASSAGVNRVGGNRQVSAVPGPSPTSAPTLELPQVSRPSELPPMAAREKHLLTGLALWIWKGVLGKVQGWIAAVVVAAAAAFLAPTLRSPDGAAVTPENKREPKDSPSQVDKTRARARPDRESDSSVGRGGDNGTLRRASILAEQVAMVFGDEVRANWCSIDIDNSSPAGLIADVADEVERRVSLTGTRRSAPVVIFARTPCECGRDPVHAIVVTVTLQAIDVVVGVSRRSSPSPVPCVTSAGRIWIASRSAIVESTRRPERVRALALMAELATDTDMSAIVFRE